MLERNGRGAIFREAMAMARQSLLLPRMATELRQIAPAPHLTVFVHGYMASGGVFAPMAAYLASRGAAPRQLHFTYAPLGSIARLAERLGRLIRDAQPAGGPVHVVAHSLGGLVARYYLQVMGGRIDRLVCLATPHRGTRRATPWTSLPLAREIVPGSETLRLLEVGQHRLANTRICSIVAEGDALVTPVESAALEGHEVVRLPGVGHQGLLFDARAWSHVERVLRVSCATPDDVADTVAA